MFILYYKPTCSFSERVIQMAKNLNASLDLQDITESEVAFAEMMSKGGEDRTPFFVDTETDASMYESSDIIDYLREHGKQASPITISKPRVHVGGSVCESCEG